MKQRYAFGISVQGRGSETKIEGERFTSCVQMKRAFRDLGRTLTERSDCSGRQRIMSGEVAFTAPGEELGVGRVERDFEFEFWISDSFMIDAPDFWYMKWLALCVNFIAATNSTTETRGKTQFKLGHKISNSTPNEIRNPKSQLRNAFTY